MEITKLKVAFVAIVIVLTGLWALSLPEQSFAGGFWSVRNSLVYYTGVLAIGCMSIGVMLAARPVQIEPALGGLDKFYRLHRWLGIAGAGLAVAHWLLEITPRWMVEQGWLAAPQRRGASGRGAAGLQPFSDLRGIAAEIGEWGLYLLLILVAIALWKRFPYRWFFRTHRLLAVVFLLLVFHSVVLMPGAYWTAPIGPVMALLLAGGVVAAAISLFRRIGHARKAVGTIESLQRHLGNAVLDVGIRLETAWPGHHAGQFAFVTFEDREGAHPFTVASAWHDDGRLMFSIKGLGDYTRALPDRLHVGQPVTVEGPYGRFDFHGERERQVWVAGGIGITPFIAGLQARADEGAGHPLDLIYSTSAPDEAFIDNIRQLAREAGARFHLLVTPRDGLLTLDRLEEIAPAWQEAEVWFCGPLGFGQALREAMVARGLPAGRFHQELFDMR